MADGKIKGEEVVIRRLLKDLFVGMVNGMFEDVLMNLLLDVFGALLRGFV